MNNNTEPVIGADYYPINAKQVIKLIPLDKLKKLRKGTKIYTVGGREVVVGNEELDDETMVFKRSKYGELLPAPIDV